MAKQISKREARPILEHILANYAGKLRIAVCVMNAHGHIVASTLLPKSPRRAHIADNARRRAWTSRWTGLETRFGEEIEKVLMVRRLRRNRDEVIDTEPGGIPLIINGVLVGAIGVSGSGVNHDLAAHGQEYFLRLRQKEEEAS